MFQVLEHKNICEGKHLQCDTKYTCDGIQCNCVIDSSCGDKKKKSKVNLKKRLSRTFSIDILTDLHYNDLKKFGATSVSLSQEDSDLCSDQVCDTEVYNNEEKVCDGAAIKQDCGTSLHCRDMCSCLVTANCEAENEVEETDYSDESTTTEVMAVDEEETLEENKSLDIQNAVS